MRPFKLFVFAALLLVDDIMAVRLNPSFQLLGPDTSLTFEEFKTLVGRDDEKLAKTFWEGFPRPHYESKSERDTHKEMFRH